MWHVQVPRCRDTRQHSTRGVRLIAAMRAFVANKFGDEVGIPEELR